MRWLAPEAVWGGLRFEGCDGMLFFPLNRSGKREETDDAGPKEESASVLLSLMVLSAGLFGLLEL